MNNNLIVLGMQNVDLVLQGDEIKRVFINERDKAEEFTNMMNEDNESWIGYSLENISTYGMVKANGINRISIITKYSIPVSVYLNNLLKAESEFAMLSKDFMCDYGTYQIIRDMVV